MLWPRFSPQILPLLITISPMIGLVTTVVISRWNRSLVRPMAIANSTITLLLVATAVWMQPHVEPTASRDVRKGQSGVEWLAMPSRAPAAGPASSTTGIKVRLTGGQDGIALWSAVLLALSVWAVLSYRDSLPDSSEWLTCSGLLASQTLLLAAGFSTDAVVAIVLLELSVLPIALIIGTAGDNNRRHVAASWWTWQLTGGVCSLVGLTMLAVSQPWMQAELVPARGAISFDINHLASGIQQLLSRSETAVHIWSHLAPWAAAMLVCGLLIRLPTFPFQGWYASTLVSAPTGISIVVAAAFPLVACVAWLRLGMPLFGMNEGLASSTVGVASLAGLIHAGLKARSEKDLKHLFALLSCAMLSLAGIALSFHNADGVRAAWLMMLSQGLAVPCGLLLTQSLESRWGTRDVSRLSDLVATSPRLAMALGTLLLGWTSVPLLTGFSAIYQQLAGASSAGVWLILGESLGLVLLAMTGLRVFTEMMTPTTRKGSVTTASSPSHDLRISELLIQLPMIAMLVAVIVAPMLFVQACDTSIPGLQQVSRQP